MHCVCEKQSDGKLDILVRVQNMYGSDLYRSSALKRRVIIMYAWWVAMGILFDKYMEKMKGSRAELYKYICEYPTIEESKQHIKLAFGAN
jgi:hypothetical protein